MEWLRIVSAWGYLERGKMFLPNFWELGHEGLTEVCGLGELSTSDGN